MALPKPPKDYYELEEIAAEFGWNVKDLLYYSDKKMLKICLLVSPTELFPLSAYKARQAIESPLEFLLSYRRLLPYGVPITLVISRKEKERFEKKIRIDTSDTAKGQQQNQESVVDKIGIAELEQIAKDIQKSEKDESVVAARLRDEHGAKAWQLVKILNIASHLDDDKNRDRAALRLAKKGRKILEDRAAPK